MLRKKSVVVGSTRRPRSIIKSSTSRTYRGTTADSEPIGKLYAPFGYPWRCRNCYGLTYATRQAAPHYRQILKAQKIRERLGGDLGVINAFPDKPKGMHWRRYKRLRAVHDQAVGNSLTMRRPFIDRALADVSDFTGAMQTKGRRQRGRRRA